MEYAGSYALFNYRLEEPEKGLEYDNLRLIRAFEHGLDPSSSEAGFVLVHVAMVKESGAIVKGAVEALNGAAARNREHFDDGMRTLVDGLKKVNAVMNSAYSSVRSLCSADVCSHVESQQAARVHLIPDLHIWHHISVNVPEWSGL